MARQAQQAAEQSLALATAKAEERRALARAAEQQATADRLAERARLSRERAKAAEFARTQAAAEAARQNNAQAQLQITPKPLNRSISDDDFDFVAGKFFALKTAIENKDIGSVIAVTQRSGRRVQQMLQLFENNVSVKARISNVASRNAEGVIVGRLQIQKLEKQSGVVVDAPANLSSITLTSKYGSDGWSAIAW